MIPNAVKSNLTKPLGLKGLSNLAQQFYTAVSDAGKEDGPIKQALTEERGKYFGSNALALYWSAKVNEERKLTAPSSQQRHHAQEETSILYKNIYRKTLLYMELFAVLAEESDVLRPEMPKWMAEVNPPQGAAEGYRGQDNLCLARLCDLAATELRQK